MRRATTRGFTLVEVMVALVVVALGLTALMVAVNGTARTSGFLRDKTVAQWIALNRIEVVRLTVNRTGDTKDTGELDFASRKWHYDTRYFDTTFPSMKRIVVRVWAGDAKTKGNPVAEATGFIGSAIGTPGLSNRDWTVGTSATANNAPCATAANGASQPLVAGSAQNSSLPPCTNGTVAPTVVTPAPTVPVTSQ